MTAHDFATNLWVIAAIGLCLLGFAAMLCLGAWAIIQHIRRAVDDGIDDGLGGPWGRLD